MNGLDILYQNSRLGKYSILKRVDISNLSSTYRPHIRWEHVFFLRLEKSALDDAVAFPFVVVNLVMQEVKSTHNGYCIAVTQ